MLDLGKIQTEVMNGIRDASDKGDAFVLGVLGPIAAEMERKALEWESRLKAFEGASVPEQGRAPDPLGVTVDFTGKRISGVTILGESIPVGSYKDALLAVARSLQAKHRDFDEVAPTVHGRFPYFSENKSDLRNGEKLRNSKFFIETHNSAERQWKISVDLVKAFGHDPRDRSVLRFHVEPNRTRARKGARVKEVV